MNYVLVLLVIAGLVTFALYHFAPELYASIVGRAREAFAALKAKVLK